ncbi:hypothetical protein ACVOMS_17620 [Bradyrhizobium guangxiense]
MNEFDFGNDPYSDLPDDPEDAFLQLEAHFKDECERTLRSLDQNDRTDVVYVDYMAKVLGAINALGLEGNFKSEVPSIGDVDYSTYLNFNKDVTHYRTVLRIRRSLREQGYSVQFDEIAKSKIHHHLDQILELFNKLEIEEEKRERLISRLNDLQNEVSLKRTRFDRLAALSIEVASVAGEFVEKSKMLDLLGAISRVFWGAQTEKQKRLPPPETQKQIEPPRPKIEKKSPMDDDIPF